MSIKLTDAQLVVLSAAMRQEYRCLEIRAKPDAPVMLARMAAKRRSGYQAIAPSATPINHRINRPSVASTVIASSTPTFGRP